MKIPYSSISKFLLRGGLVAALVGSFSFGLQAQIAPAIQWDRTFGGNYNDVIRSLEQTSDGGYILGGYSLSNISGDKSENSRGQLDYWVIKINANGTKIWDKTFGGSEEDVLFSVKQTSDGGYILGGYSKSGISGDKTQPSKGDRDYWVIKLGATGNKLWDKTLGGNANDNLTYIQQTTDGGYILGGSSLSGISGDKTEPARGFSLTQSLHDYWIVKLDSFGNKLWDKTLGGTGNDALYAMQQTNDGGYILGGYSNSVISGEKSQNSQGGYDFWIIKVDVSGNKLWDKTFGGSNADELYTLQQTSDGGYILGGWSLSGLSGDKSQSGYGFHDFWVIKVDATGNKLWDKTIGGTDTDHLNYLQETTDGGFILAGISNSSQGFDKSQAPLGWLDYWVVKVDTNGNKLWDKTIGTNSGEGLYSLKQTTDGGYIIGGSSSGGINNDKTQPSQGETDYWIVKLAPEIVGLKEPAITFNLSISPNPSQGKFKLQLSNLKTAKAEVTVTDLLGRVVLQKELSVTDQQVSEELTLAAAKGMYVLQVKAGEEVISRKIVVE